MDLHRYLVFILCVFEFEVEADGNLGSGEKLYLGDPLNTEEDIPSGKTLHHREVIPPGKTLHHREVVPPGKTTHHRGRTSRKDPTS